MFNQPEAAAVIAGPILDFHTHIFPPRVAAKAVVAIGRFYELPMIGGGTQNDLLQNSRRAGISHQVVFATATRREQVDSINLFMRRCQQTGPSLSAFGTLHPDMSDSEVQAEIRQIAAYGLHGVKLHPDFQKVAADSPFTIHAARAMAGRLPLLLHSGDPRHHFSQPRQVRRLALQCPETVIIAAHLGGWGQWADAAPELAGLANIYVDTSSSLAFLNPDEAVRMIRCYDPRQVLFGTDYPMWDAAEELRRFCSLDLTAEEKRAILWENGRRLLGLPQA